MSPTRVEVILAEWPEMALTARDPRSKLYKSLAKAMEVAELVSDDPRELAYFENVVTSRNGWGGNRSYIEIGSDTYVRVCRYLFANETRHNVSRYAVAIRKGAARGLRHDGLEDFLRRNGGINALTQYNRVSSQIVECPHCRSSFPLQRYGAV